MTKLALHGGTPAVTRPLKRYRSMGEAERRAVVEVVDSDVLSGFYGSPGDEYWGGPKVQAFEAAWRATYGVRYAVSVNSATSGLFAAMGAIGLSPGDEVIVPPWTMSATVMAPLVYGGIPVFADVEPETFCIDPAAVRAAITDKTRAILAVNLFGHPAQLTALRKLADERGIWLIEDSAQAPYASENGKRAGTIGHIGVFSLNYHKHIHTGEGGVCVTDDDELGKRLQMIRNHAENATDWLKVRDLANMIGFNYRMTELNAAIGLAQLAKIEEHVARREAVGAALTEGLSGLAGIRVPKTRPNARHNYYCWVMRYDARAVGVSRATFARALQAEGFPHGVGYLRPLYMLPAFQQRKAIGRDGFPFTLTNRTYSPGMCPVVERLHTEEAILFEPCAWDLDAEALAQLVAAVRKVHAQAPALAAAEKQGAGAAVA